MLIGVIGLRIKHESISMERLDGETIVINFDTGQYFSFRGTAADVLWLIAEGHARDQWRNEMDSIFDDVPAKEDFETQIAAFVTDLIQVDILDAEGTTQMSDSALPNDYLRTVWTVPTVKSHEDLVDLLALDPIHDAGNDGWPQSNPT